MSASDRDSIATVAVRWWASGWSTCRRLIGVVRADRTLSTVVGTLLVIDLFWIVLYCVTRALRIMDLDSGYLGRNEFRITTDLGYPEWFNYAKILLIVVLTARLARATRQMVYVSLSVLYVVVLLDDSVEIHEFVGEYFVKAFGIHSVLGLRAQDVGELITWALLGAIVMPLVFFGLRRASRVHLGVGLALLVPFAALLVFAVGVDQLYSNFSRAFPGAGLVLDATEDGGEMLAITLACALALGAQRQLVTGPEPRPSPT